MRHCRCAHARDGLALLETVLLLMLLPPGLITLVDGVQVVATHQTMARAVTAAIDAAVASHPPSAFVAERLPPWISAAAVTNLPRGTLQTVQVTTRCVSLSPLTYRTTLAGTARLLIPWGPSSAVPLTVTVTGP